MRSRLSLEALEERTLLSAGTYGQLPLSFVPNVGQSAPQVQFLSSGNGYGLFLTPSQTVLDLHASASGGNASSVLALSLVGANPDSRAVGQDPLPGTANYFSGPSSAQWYTNIPTYAQVQYSNIYAGIDLVYYGNQGQLEYDFVANPGASPGTIRLQLLGAQSVHLDAQGNLVLAVSGRTVLQQAPNAYQEIAGIRRAVASRYVIENDGQIGFAVGAYNSSVPLVIDPVLSYSTYLGGTLDDTGTGIAVDRAGEAFVAGTTYSPDFPSVSNGYGYLPQGPHSGDYTAFVAKLNAAGTELVYTSFLDILHTRGAGIAVDAAGDAFLTGTTALAGDFPTVHPVLPLPPDFFGIAFVTEFNETGNQILYSTPLGGSGYGDAGTAVAVDGSGDVYVTGYTQSSDFPTLNAAQPTHEAGQGDDADAFVTKLNSATGAIIYSTYLGGLGYDTGSGIAVDSGGDTCVAGYTLATDFPMANGLPSPPGYPNDLATGFVAKIGPNGGPFLYSTLLSAAPSYANAIAVDTSGNAWVAGGTSASDFPTTANAVQPHHAGSPSAHSSNAFVTELTSGNTIGYSTFLGGSGSGSRYGDAATGIALDGAGDVFLTGYTSSTDFPTLNPVQASATPGSDAFVTEFNPSAQRLIYSTYLGSTSGDTSGSGIAVDSAGNAYVTGTINNGTSFPTANPIQNGWAGQLDAFVSKLSNNTWWPTAVSVNSSGNTNLLWDAPSYTSALWSINSSGAVSAAPTAGPYPNWIGTDIASGSDGLTRILWVNHAALVWLVGANGQFQNAMQYGPIAGGWLPKSIAAGSNGQTYLLWTSPSDQAIIWTLDAQLNVTGFSPVFDPGDDWTATKIATGADGMIRLLWTNPNGETAVWRLDGTGNVASATVFGAIAGWTPIGIAVGSDNLTRILWSNVDGSAAVWLLNGQLAAPVAVVYGPIAGWTAEGLAGAPDGTTRLLWYNLNGQAAVWTLDAADLVQSTSVFGPL